ncbi:MAG: hypothetical protein JWR67_229 [Mucilaginibacter sp.]|nr:hypothetical protein [Mucilaginibacter sp.]
MKKYFLSIALISTMIGSIVTGCSSQKKVDSTDSTSTHTTTTTDTSKATHMDTTKKDTSRKPPR